jgi:hypothetical protein
MTRRLVYSTASSPREDGIMSVPNMVGHDLWLSMGRVNENKCASLWRVLALDKIEALKEPKQHRGCTMDSVEV